MKSLTSARLKLTSWYLFIIMLISIIFSVVIYSLVSRQIEGFIHMQNDRAEHFEAENHDDHHPRPPLLTIEDAKDQEMQLIYILVFINGVILLVSGGAGYFLAGRTLRPIKLMIDEQNQFISSSSHELRTPIATLRAEMEGSLLEKHISDTQARNLIKSNLEELGTLQELTNNLLKLAQIHNSTDAHFEPVSLAEVISRSHKKVHPLARKKHIGIDINVKDSAVNGDKARLIELFVILFENAIKYSPEKTKITVNSDETKDKISVHVTDQGFGISSDDLPHIFGRFYRADKSRSGTDGYGLGLSIAQKIIETHNGTISVKSTESKGTTFVISFPLISS
jgi:two-component system sensor histidine kinase CiaH